MEHDPPAQDSDMNEPVLQRLSPSDEIDIPDDVLEDFSSRQWRNSSERRKEARAEERHRSYVTMERLFRWSLYIFAGVTLIVGFVVMWHYIMPESCLWLNHGRLRVLVNGIKGLIPGGAITTVVYMAYQGWLKSRNE